MMKLKNAFEILLFFVIVIFTTDITNAKSLLPVWGKQIVKNWETGNPFDMSSDICSDSIGNIYVINGYYSAVEKNINSLVTYPFCHNFCLKNTKFLPKLLRFQIYNPTLKHGAIDNQLDKPAE